MNKTSNCRLCSFVFYHTVILVGKTFGEKIRPKIFPKNGKRLNWIWIFWILVVWELPLPSIILVIQSAHACQTVQNSTEQYRTVQNSTEQYRTVQNSTEQYRTVQNGEEECLTVLYCSVTIFNYKHSSLLIQIVNDT